MAKQKRKNKKPQKSSKFEKKLKVIAAIAAIVLTIMQIYELAQKTGVVPPVDVVPILDEDKSENELLYAQKLAPDDSEVEIMDTWSLTYSECIPYSSAGYVSATYSGYKSAMYRGEHELSCNRAFSIRSFLQNFEDTRIRVQDVRTDILSLMKIEEDDVYIIFAMNGGYGDNVETHKLKAYAINNGWGYSAMQQFSCSFSDYRGFDYSYPDYDGRPILQDIFDNAVCLDSFTLAPGEILQIAEYSINMKKWEKFMSSSGGSSIIITYSLNGTLCDEHEIYSLSYSEYLDYFSLDIDPFTFYCIGDPDPYYVSLFSVLDIDNSPAQLIYTSPKATPFVGESQCIETVIAPTKSCVIECQNSFIIGESKKVSPKMQITVTVPVYSGLYSMIYKIAKLDQTDIQLIKNIAHEYRYNPEIILQNASNHSDFEDNEEVLSGFNP